MVLFKRKPVQFLVPPAIEDESDEVWLIPQTGEVFATYEDYLTRMDFYKQRRFICQITGHSGLTFFEALESETAGAQEVEQAFPEPLKGPILRRVQFQTVSRIDHLVDQIYDEFKTDYYPGETVTVNIHTGERLQGIVRDKTRFGSKVLPDGTLTPPFSRYFVSLVERPDEEAVVDDSHMSRDRRTFTKSVLRSFIKKTVTREAWNGAPWLVKHDIANQYKIDTRVPPHLRYDTKLMERKQVQAQKRMVHPQDMNGLNNAFTNNGPVRLPELKPAHTKAQKGKQGQGQGGKGNKHHGPEPGAFVHLPLPGNPFQFGVPYRNHGAMTPVFTPEPPPPPPPPKYPIEDLQLEPRDIVRPALKYLCNDPPVEVKDRSPLGDKIRMNSVGPLLETWDTLNVYCEIFKLDSFTFDDYVEALQIASEETPCQLFDEIHCAVLKVLVNSEADGGKVQFKLPELEEDDEDDEEEEDEEEDADSDADPEPQPTGRATRSSMAKLEAERLAAEVAAAQKESEEAENAPKHRAEDVLADYDWLDHLRKRDFKDGGWELIMVGLLHQLSHTTKQSLHASCEELLIQLVPRDVEATQETVRQHYAALDVNYRIQALQIICMLTAETKAIRAYMEDCSEQMTAFRKEKIDWQRQRKQAMEELKQLNDQRKILLPDNIPNSPSAEAINGHVDVEMSGVEEMTPAEDEVADSDDEAPRGRSLRRAQDRAAERQQKEKERLEKKEKAEAAKASKQSKQFAKLLKEIQKKEEFISKCEEEVAVIDNDLREADCPRTRVLGKDRFWNRYYWFERNGMPYGGLPDSSTASADYANACLWIQGPSDLEREGYIDMQPDYQNEYKAKFNMTVPERKKREEGETSVYTSKQWGYYCEPEDVEKLLEWLDPRGYNELKLRKEILNFKEKIIKHMKNRKAYLNPGDKEEKKDDSKRMSTRTRNAQTPEPRHYRCLDWENTTAMEELGHLHSEQPPPPQSRKRGRKKETIEAAPPPKKGRQGTRYNF